MPAPDTNETEFDFDELVLDETNEEIEASDGQEGQEGSEGGGRESEAGDEGTEADSQRPVGRRERRLQSLANKARDSDRRAIEAEAREKALQQQIESMRQQPQMQQPQYDPRAEQEYLAALDPAERLSYQFNKQLQAVQQQNQQQQYMMLEFMDKNAYQAKAAANPVYKQFEAEVEKMRAAEASRGRHFNREDILAFLIGQKMLNSKKSNKPKPKVTPRAMQTTRPGNASSDAAATRQQDNERSARNKRLATYTF